MKKNIINLIYFILLLLGCKQNVNSNYGDLFPKEINLDNEVSKFVSDFVQSKNNSDCIYELYIDKKTKDEYFLNVCNIPNDSTYFSNHFPVSYTMIENKIIFIYSGIEDFVEKKDYAYRFNITKNKKQENDISYESISKVINKDTSYVVGFIGIPFIDVKFLPPIFVPDE